VDRRFVQFVFCLFALAALLALAREPSPMAAQARQAYELGRYDEASKLYALMASSGYDGAEVQFDLGNSLLKGGDVAKAIVAYRRALQFEPDMKAAISNLATARKLLPAKAVAWQPSPWEAAITSIGTDKFMFLTLFLAFAGNVFLCAALFLAPGRARRALAALMTALFIAAAVSGGCLYYGVKVAPLHQPVVVISPAKVTEKAGAEGAVLATLPAGSEVVRVASAGDWSLLIWGDGSGWTESANVEAP
jgi:tetratricopeptide (TPR) repeat protein